jgi:hypothetical protein
VEAVVVQEDLRQSALLLLDSTTAATLRQQRKLDHCRLPDDLNYLIAAPAPQLPLSLTALTHDSVDVYPHPHPWFGY